jgi:LDH2 family malate/lactate/ureidoglycolate dehydrogenase
MLVAELFGRTLTGADAHADTSRGGPAIRHQGVTMIVTRADLFQHQDAFLDGVDRVLDAVRAVPPAPGFDEVLVPGERAARAAERQRDGIDVPAALWSALTSNKFTK